MTIEWFIKHTKELRHEDRVQQDARGDGTRLSMGKRKRTGKMKYVGASSKKGSLGTVSENVLMVHVLMVLDST